MLTRKTFSNRVIFFLLCILLVSCETPSLRQTVLLNGEWNFVIDSTSSGETENWAANGLPNELTRKVTVPHTWNSEKGNEKYTGIAWYERAIEVPKEQLSKITRLQFDAVYHDAFIYINGKLAGKHLGSGYNRFFVDATSFLNEGENRLTVCVDNSLARDNIPFMESFDWAGDGGITRDVKEVITDKYAIRNIHVTPIPENDGGTAEIKINFLNELNINPSELTLEAVVVEENQPTQSVIYKGKLNGELVDDSFIANLNFDKINLWHFDSPNLYELSVKLLINGKEKDQLSTTFGFRTIKIENDRYVLNGEPMRLMGVEWMPGSHPKRGMAETKEDLENNLKLMKNANCIFTRFHWQQDEYVFDWCDRHGILVQEEIPYWGIWTLLNDTLLPKGIQHLEEMIDNHFNHPSIISWGIGNELLAHEPMEQQGLNKLYGRAKSLDPNRLSNYVTNALHFDMPSENPERYDATYDFDMIMFNEYYSTHYHMTLDTIPFELDRLHGEYPNKPMTISEWGLCDPVQPGGDERRAREMVKQIEYYGEKPYIAGAIYFCLNDYRTQRSSDYSKGYPIRDHGVVDVNLKKKKSYPVLQKISSPIEIVKIEKSDGKVVLGLKGKTGIPSYIIRDYSIVSGNNKVTINELNPGEEKSFEIKTDGNSLQILRTTGFEVAHIDL